MVIVLPPPDERLHAHAKGHWRDKAKATKVLRDVAYVLAKNQHVKPMGKAVIKYHFYVKDNRRRDMANLIQSQKAAIDGLVDAGVIPDDAWQVLGIAGVTVMIDRKNPRVELELTEVSE